MDMARFEKVLVELKLPLLKLIDDGHLFLLTNREAVVGTILGFLREEDPLGHVAGDRVPGRTLTTCAN